MLHVHVHAHVCVCGGHYLLWVTGEANSGSHVCVGTDFMAVQGWLQLDILLQLHNISNVYTWESGEREREKERRERGRERETMAIHSVILLLYVRCYL